MTLLLLGTSIHPQRPTDYSWWLEWQRLLEEEDIIAMLYFFMDGY
jgi:hypothetical protein